MIMQELAPRGTCHSSLTAGIPTERSWTWTGCPLSARCPHLMVLFLLHTSGAPHATPRPASCGSESFRHIPKQRVVANVVLTKKRREMYDRRRFDVDSMSVECVSGLLISPNLTWALIKHVSPAMNPRGIHWWAHTLRSSTVYLNRLSWRAGRR
jgi:hypothetical protein